MQIQTRAYTRKLAESQWTTVTGGNFSGPAVGLHVHLATAFAVAPSIDTVWADVTEATYDGYASQALAVPTAEFDTTQSADGVCPMLTWAPTAGTTPNIVLALVYTDNAVAGNVMGVDILNTPVSMNGTTTGFTSVTIIDTPWQSQGKPPTVVQ